MLRTSILSLISINLFLGLVHYFPATSYIWLLPLILYVMSIYLALATNHIINHPILLLAAPFFILPLLIPLTLQLPPNVYSYTLYSIIFFFLGLVCHNEIITEKKNHSSARSFAFFISVGCVIGCGMALMLSMLKLFHGFSFAVSIMLLSFFLPSLSMRKITLSQLDISLPFLLCIVLMSMRFIYSHLIVGPVSTLWTVLYCILASITCFSFRSHSLRFGIGIVAIITAAVFLPDYFPWRAETALFGIKFTNEIATLICAMPIFLFLRNPVIFKQETAHGSIQVVHNLRNNTLELNHGKIVHGAQSIKTEQHCDPLSYYSRQGPLGQLFDAIPSDRQIKEIAAIGLGVGTLAVYGKENQHITFYEINPLIESIARNRNYFTYLSQSNAKTQIIIGDARQSINKASTHFYDMIICDAYMGAHIPKHLITREAIELYCNKLKAQGLLVFHITGQLINLIPVLGKIAHHTHLTGVFQHHVPTEYVPANDPRKQSWSKPSRWMQKLLATCGLTYETNNPNCVSLWAVLAREKEDLTMLGTNKWRPLDASSDSELWTDSLWHDDATFVK